MKVGAGKHDAALLVLLDPLHEVDRGSGGSADGGGDGRGGGDHGIGVGVAIGSGVSDVADGLGGARVRVLEGGGGEGVDGEEVMGSGSGGGVGFEGGGEFVGNRGKEEGRSGN